MKKDAQVIATTPLTEAQMEQGREWMHAQLLEHAPHQSHVWEKIFAADAPGRVLPSAVHIGKITYVPTPEKPRRTITTLLRYLTRQAGVERDAYVDAGVASALARVATLYSVEDEFRILRGEEIKKAYAAVVGAKSCMTGEDPVLQRRLQFYADNPERVGLLVWRVSQGRALLWTAPNGDQFLDRIYAGDIPAASEAYKRYCRNVIGERYAGSHSGWIDLKSKPEFCLEVNWGKLRSEDRPPYFDSLSLYDGRWLFRGGGLCGCCQRARAPQAIFDDLAQRHGFPAGTKYCNNCIRLFFACPGCGKAHRKDYACEYGGDSFCGDCWSKRYFNCYICGQSKEKSVHVRAGRFDTCRECAQLFVDALAEAPAH